MLRTFLLISTILVMVGCGEDKSGRSGAGEPGAGEGDDNPGGDEDGDDGEVDPGDQGGDDPPDPGDNVGDNVGGEGEGEAGGGAEGEGEGEGGAGDPLPEAYELIFTEVLPPEVEGVASVRVTVFDDLGARSEPTEVEVAPQPIVGRDELCDPIEGLNMCADGDICFVEPIVDDEGEDPGDGEDPGEDPGEGDEGEGEGDEGEGEEGGEEGGEDGEGGEGEGEAGRAETCADDVLDFFATATHEGDDWWVSGNNEQGGLLEGSCGGGNGQEVVYSFTAPEAGIWNITTVHEDTGFDTLMYARSACDDDAFETELACNDDSGGLQSRIQVEVEADQQIWVIVDAFGGAGIGDFVLTAYRMQVSAPGEPCDPDGARRVCRPADDDDDDDNGDFCFVTPPAEDDPEAVATGECLESTPPNIANALAYADGDFLSLQLFGEDSSRDVVGLVLELMEGESPVVLNEDTGQTEVPADFTNRDEIYGQAEFVGRIRFAGLEMFPQTDGVRVKLVDSQGLGSNTIIRSLGPIPALGEGEVCDLEGILNGCADTGVCLPPELPEPEEGDEGEGEAPEEPLEPPTEGTCVVPYVPVIVAVDALYDDTSKALGLSFDVADEDEDVAGFSLDLLNADGFPIPLGPEREPGDYFDIRFPDEPRDPGQCIEAVRDCPADFDILEIPEDEDNDRWFATGDTTGAPVGAESGGTCGGGGAGRHIYAFAPFEDGAYTFTTDSVDPGADTVVYIRTLCGFTSPRAELGCNDDYLDDGTYMSSLTVDLVANDTVWVFVDGFAGFGGGWEGNYTLSVTREL